ncbi:MAG TPA: hypothetical protein VGM56_27150 [Byssovorax sp.]
MREPAKVHRGVFAASMVLGCALLGAVSCANTVTSAPPGAGGGGESAISSTRASTVASGGASTVSTGPGASSTTTSTASAGGGGAPSAGGGASTGSGETGGAGGRSSEGGGGAGGGACHLCSDAVAGNPVDPSELCTNDGPESSLDYFDAALDCCNANCPMCGTPCVIGGLHTTMCGACISGACAAPLLDCGRCASCADVANGVDAPSRACPVGSSPSSNDLYQALLPCLCGACASDCAASACQPDGSPDLTCLQCAQAMCASPLSSCLADTSSHSG